MKIAFKKDGTLILTAENSIEAFALLSWHKDDKGIDLVDHEGSDIVAPGKPVQLSTPVINEGPVPTKPAECAQVYCPAPVEAAQLEVKHETKAVDNIRENIKKELIALGVEFAPKASTATLEKTLAKAKENANPTVMQEVAQAAPAPVAEPVAAFTPAPQAPVIETPAVISSEDLTKQAIEVCRAYALSHGQEKARSLVVSLGGQKISDLTDANKINLINKINAETAPRAELFQ